MAKAPDLMETPDLPEEIKEAALNGELGEEGAPI